MADSEHVSCRCARCCSRGYMGPAIMVTLGLLFLIDQFTRYSFHETWPILLIVIGLVVVLQRTASSAGHVGPGNDAQHTHGPQAPNV